MTEVEDVIRFVQEMSYEDKCPSAADVAQHFEIHVNTARSLLERAVKKGVIGARFSEKHGKNFYYFISALEEYIEKKRGWRKIFNWWR